MALYASSCVCYRVRVSWFIVIVCSCSSVIFLLCSCCCSRHFNFRLFAVILAATYTDIFILCTPTLTNQILVFFCSHGFSKLWRFTTKLHFVELPRLAARILSISRICKVHLYWLFGVFVVILCFHGSLKREEKEKERIV